MLYRLTNWQSVEANCRTFLNNQISVVLPHYLVDYFWSCTCTVFIHIEARTSIFYRWFLTWHLIESGVYLNTSVNLLLFTLQGRMAGASTSINEFDDVVRGQHVYKSVWTLLTDWCSKTRKCILVREDDERDKYAINDWL